MVHTEELTRCLQNEQSYAIACGGYLGIEEADDIYNDMNRKSIEAFRKCHGRAYLGSVNFCDEERAAIISGEKSVYTEYTGSENGLCNFCCSFCVPIPDVTLERLIRQWNEDSSKVKVDDIMTRIEELDGIHILWY